MSAPKSVHSLPQRFECKGRWWESFSFQCENWTMWGQQGGKYKGQLAGAFFASWLFLSLNISLQLIIFFLFVILISFNCTIFNFLVKYFILPISSRKLLIGLYILGCNLLILRFKIDWVIHFFINGSVKSIFSVVCTCNIKTCKLFVSFLRLLGRLYKLLSP